MLLQILIFIYMGVLEIDPERERASGSKKFENAKSRWCKLFTKSLLNVSFCWLTNTAKSIILGLSLLSQQGQTSYSSYLNSLWDGR